LKKKDSPDTSVFLVPAMFTRETVYKSRQLFTIL